MIEIDQKEYIIILLRRKLPGKYRFRTDGVDNKIPNKDKSKQVSIVVMANTEWKKKKKKRAEWFIKVG